MTLEPGLCVYRGIDGNMDLPEFFYKPDSHGRFGMTDPGFVSTTSELAVAISYTGIARGGKAHPTVLKVVMDSVDRGADISEFSQYPGEQEAGVPMGTRRLHAAHRRGDSRDSVGTGAGYPSAVQRQPQGSQARGLPEAQEGPAHGFRQTADAGPSPSAQ